MRPLRNGWVVVFGMFAAFVAPSRSPGADVEVSPYLLKHAQIASPNGALQFKVMTENGRLEFAITSGKRAIIEPSPMRFTVDGVDLTDGAQLERINPYRIEETYPWRGAHSRATNRCSGA